MASFENATSGGLIVGHFEFTGKFFTYVILLYYAALSVLEVLVLVLRVLVTVGKVAVHVSATATSSTEVSSAILIALVIVTGLVVLLSILGVVAGRGVGCTVLTLGQGLLLNGGSDSSVRHFEFSTKLTRSSRKDVLTHRMIK